MDKQKCIDIIGNGLNSNFISFSLTRKKEVFVDTFNMIRSHIAKMENDEEIEYTYSIENLMETLNFSLDYVSTRHLNEDLTEFFTAWFTLIFNWNENLNKNDEIGRKCRTGIRLLEQFISIKEAIGMMKKCTDHMRRFSGWMPPAFEVSRHILDRLDDKKE